MKAAIYLEDGVTQIALTAEDEWEKAVLAQIDGKDLSVFRGGFYACQGGWFRHDMTATNGAFFDATRTPPDSVILRINKTVEAPRAP